MYVTRSTNLKLQLSCFVVILLVAGLTGCSSLSNTEKGAAIGAGTGAALGGIIGKAATDNGTAEGAILGAAVGGTVGAVIGRRMDKQAKELDQKLEGANVERVGEGIKVTFDSGILFDFDSADLRPAARANLSDLASSLEDHDNTEILIVGHTDAVGAESYNQGLSKRRASSAARYLMNQDVRQNRVTSVGRGETEPVGSNDTETGRQQNRRVEIAIYADKKYRKELKEKYGSS